MRVALVNPPYTFWMPGMEHLAQVLGRQPPMGLVSLAAYARAHAPDLRITILDAVANSWSNERTADKVIAAGPDVVGITMTTVVARNARLIAERVKAALPRATIVVGGPHVSCVGEECLRRSAAFDLAVAGEGERTFVEILEAVRDKRPHDRTAGVILRDERGSVRRNAPRDPIEELDSLPLPAWDLLPGFPQKYLPNALFSPRGPMASLTTSRGCPFECAFCDQSTFGARYRAASAEWMFRAVRSLQEDYGIRYLMFCDDTFALDRRRVRAFCDAMRSMAKRPAWSCDANVMTVDRALLREMKRAGCWSISYGLESGSPKVLESLRKRIALSRAREMVAETRACGIHAKGLFMMGTPEESAESARMTRRFMRSLPLSTLNLSKFTPYPGSPAEFARRRLGVAMPGDGSEADYETLNGMNFVIPTRHLTIAELEREYDRTIRYFFARFRSCASHIAIWMGEWRNICRLMRAARRMAGVKFRAATNQEGSRAV